MEPPAATVGQLVDSSKQFARRLFTTGENRLELLMVELQEERDYQLHAIVLALVGAVLGLLAMLALNMAIVILLWNHWPVAALLTLTGIYTLSAVLLYRRLGRLLGEWKMFSATLDQLRKDRECLEKHLV